MLRLLRIAPVPGAIRLVVAAWTVAVAGCEQAQLPECDMAAAQEIVFLDAPSDVTNDDGLPMYAGQALLHQSCGGGAYCHASEAEDRLRVGTPAGLDWNVGVPCVDAPCASGSDTRARFDEDLARLRRRARDLYDSVVAGEMPPGHVGREVVRRIGVVRRAPPPGGTLGEGQALPSIETDEGRAIFGSWLACGAPVVQTALPPDPTHAPGDPCTRSPDDAGECVTRIPPGVAPFATCASTPTVPSWESLYTRLFGPVCADGCHGTREPRAGELSMSDTMERAYERLLEPDGDETLVVPGSAAASHLPHHLDGNPSYDLMPPGLLSGTLPDAVLEAIRDWIAAGAPGTCP